MKTAISIPDKVFEEAERLAERLQTSRSQLYTRALAEFVARHDDDQVAAAMNRVADELEHAVDSHVRPRDKRCGEWNGNRPGRSLVGRHRRADWFGTRFQTACRRPM